MAAIGEAIDAARNDPDRDREEIIGEVVTRLEPRKGIGGPTVDFRKQAEEALGAAKQGADDLGEHPDVAGLDAMIGIGYSLLAIGADAEVFFSLVAGRDAA